ncbi:MAG: hypothetical protein ACTSSG_14865 [Candidatus Heimdallarchaeaceae archaeon]
MTTLKSVTTKLPENVLTMWKEHCKKQGKTSYELLNELIAKELGIDLKKGWVIRPLNLGAEE